MLNDINLDAIPSGETRAAILILVGRLQALEDQVKALVSGLPAASSDETSGQAPPVRTATPRKPKRAATKVTKA